MSYQKGKTEGGSGGKRGHSNMNHWSKTEEIKTASRKQRRVEGKRIVTQELTESQNKRGK